MVRAFAAAACVMSLLFGCLSAPGFTCATDSDCRRTHQRGVCEHDGYCSYPDASCGETRRRYGEHSGERAGRCVDVATCALTCDDGNECTVETCTSDGACLYADTEGDCEDGVECTSSTCDAGRCKSGPWEFSLPACQSGAVPIFRSVGAKQTTLLAAGGVAAELSIRGETATFTDALPENAGVGDVLEYDSDGNGERDSLAFLSGRGSAQSFRVRAASGALAQPTRRATSSWLLFRAYTSLADLQASRENESLLDSLQDFDLPPGERNLAARGQAWAVACYAAVDDGLVELSGFGTDAARRLRIYTPVSPDEVGAPQRHKGKWDWGYRLRGGLVVREPFTSIEGLAVRQDGAGPLVEVVVEQPGEVSISSCYAERTGGVGRVFGVSGAAAEVKVRLYNDIGVNRSSEGGGVFVVDQPAATVLLDNDTAAAVAGFGFSSPGGGVTRARNCLGVANGAAAAFAGGLDVEHSASTDGSADDHGGAQNLVDQPVVFVDAAGGDYHLSPSDAHLQGRGLNLAPDLEDDIDGEPRPAGAWDIGADEVP